MTTVLTPPATYIEKIPPGMVPLSIVASSMLYLFAQLATIRLHAVFLPIIGFYKNISLLACFLGIGLGFLISHRKSSTIAQVGFRFCLPIIFLWVIHVLNFGELVSPNTGELTMGLNTVDTTMTNTIVSLMLVMTLFALTAYAFIPLGELCGRCMAQERSTLRAYSLNLGGSLLGITLFSGLGFLNVGGAVWITVIAALVMPFLVFSTKALISSAISLAVVAVVTVFPVDPTLHRLYSPYQGLTLHTRAHEEPEILTNGLYYQRMLNLSEDNLSLQPDFKRLRDYYNLAYTYVKNPQSVLVVGAGSGNDVSAALRNGAGTVDAVEIEPLIYQIGRELHPEQPYKNPAVRVHLTDARQFMQRTSNTYDLIVYGLLDSHAVINAKAGGVRLDSFVYTVEAFQRARALLNKNGVLALSFVHMSPAFSKKMAIMLQQAFDGRPPAIFKTDYDLSYTYIIRDAPFTKGEELAHGYTDIKDTLLAHDEAIDVATDDWPFIYMPQRVFPIGYLLVLAMSLVISAVMITKTAGLSSHKDIYLAPFFLGAAFMLLETKAITELSLQFGSVFTVIAITIFAILSLAYLANGIVSWYGIRLIRLRAFCYGALLLAVALSYAGSFIPSESLSPAVALWVRPLILVLPIFFAGICFSLEIKDQESIAPVLASNLFGALVGGALEYNALYFGFKALYFLIFVLYGAAWFVGRRDRYTAEEKATA